MTTKQRLEQLTELAQNLIGQLSDIHGLSPEHGEWEGIQEAASVASELASVAAEALLIEWQIGSAAEEDAAE